MKKVFQCQVKTLSRPDSWYVLYSGKKKIAIEFVRVFSEHHDTVAIRLVVKTGTGTVLVAEQF